MQTRFLIYLFLFYVSQSFSQKYNFVNWTVEDGLVQSQPSYICQDNYRQLWIGTEGGISIFDGKKFKAYTVQDGLVANHINTMFCDISGNIWIGSIYGISVFNGQRFKTIKPLEKPVNNVTQIVQTDNGDIYSTDNFDLVKIKNFKSEKISVSSDSTEQITTLLRTNTDNLLVWVYKKGLFSCQQQTWKPIYVVNEEYKKLQVREIYLTERKDTLLLANTGLYALVKGTIKPFLVSGRVLADVNILCIAEDSKQNLWLGTDNGVYKIEGDKIIHFDEKSGFTDNGVNHIYKDVENNLWFATNGNGIYKFRENTFTYYDKSSGFSNTIIMGITQASDGSIYTGGYGGGLYKINQKNDIEPVLTKDPTLNSSKINCLYADDQNNIWIGTINKGTFCFNEKTGLKKLEAKNDPDLNLKGATVFLKDRYGNLFVGTNQGLFIKTKNDSIFRVKVPSQLITSLKQFDKDHVICGTSKGIFLLDQNFNVSDFHEKDFGNSAVLCLAKNNNNLWIGTIDKGVLNLDYKTGKIITYNTTDGLPSNFIYSIDVSDKHKAWIGTGFGISNLQLDANGKVLAIKNYGRSDGLLGMECNHNCLLKSADSSLWFGTTKGLFHFNPYTNIAEKNQPLILLRSVKLFSSDITDSTQFNSSITWFKVPQKLQLKSKQNHLTFELGSIYFTNPEDVLYRYKLEGIDKGYTTTGNPFIIYPALPPGKYTLTVVGITKSGTFSANEIKYTFEIEKAFYQTRFFQIMVILLLLGTGALLAYIATRGKQKRKQRAKEQLEKIREEEFMKLRQRTAEDFHDEMGNSLTRISVLTDVLKSKINGKEQDVTKLVQQIKENTTALYNGSRDIIWSLNSQNDGIYEIAEHIKDIGNELFLETPIDFQYFHNINAFDTLKLKLDYSRNLTMIFKEAFNNILKHSNANKVTVQLRLNHNNDLEILIEDNGKGYQVHTEQTGNGIQNMKNRANRMNGEITVNSVLDKGTKIDIILKNIFI